MNYLLSVIPCLLFAISASLDALLVGIAYGIKKIRFTIIQNTVISLAAMVGTSLSFFLGSLADIYFSANILSIIGSLIIILFGLYYLIHGIYTYKAGKTLPDNEAEHCINPDMALSFSNLIVLSLSLSVNNVGIGISASLAGILLFPAALSTFIFSYIFLRLGNKYLFPNVEIGTNSYYTDVAAGIMLILLGIIEL